MKLLSLIPMLLAFAGPALAQSAAAPQGASSSTLPGTGLALPPTTPPPAGAPPDARSSPRSRMACPPASERERDRARDDRNIVCPDERPAGGSTGPAGVGMGSGGSSSTGAGGTVR